MSLRPDDKAELIAMGGIAAFVLAVLALVFVGCPMAVSYGVSRGCAAGAELTR